MGLGLIHLLIRDEGYDSDFVREWTNAPFLVRDDTGMLLAAGDLDGAPGIGRRYVAAVEGSAELVVYDAERGAYATDAQPALRGARGATGRRSRGDMPARLRASGRDRRRLRAR